MLGDGPSVVKSKGWRSWEAEGTWCTPSTVVAVSWQCVAEGVADVGAGGEEYRPLGGGEK